LKPEDKEEPENGFPAVICLHQHKGDYTVGKSEVVGLTQKVLSDGYYEYGVGLVKKGFVVIAPDFKCFEERRSREFEARSKYYQKTGPEAYERFVAMNYLLQGTTFQRRMILDIKSVFDYLSKRKDVNKEQIGCIGHSLGGTEAIFAAALIPEIKAAVANCGISTYRAIQEMYVNHNFAFYIPGFLNRWDNEDLRILLDLLEDSQSLFILAGEKDQDFPVEGVRELCGDRHNFHEINDKGITNGVEYNRNRSFYWIRPEKKHEFSIKMQKEAIKFLKEKLR
jgi:dienelactone hydrolase